MRLLLAGLFAFAMAFGVLLTPSQETEAAPSSGIITEDVTGDIVGGGAFTGTIDITRFTSQGGQLIAVGTVDGTLTDALGNTIGTVTDFPVRIPVTEAAGTCEILNLTLGPLDLDLLGLVVELDTVHLEITAEQGPGNLLGNLLCAVAGLLDSQTSASALSRLLNQILGILG